MRSFKRENSIGWLLNVASNQIAVALNSRLIEHGIDIKLWPTLFTLSEHQGQTQTELAASCRTKDYTTTRILNRLEKKNLIERKACQNSRRAFRIHLTEQGEELLDTLLPIVKEENLKYIAKLSKHDQQLLESLLQSLIVQAV